MIIDDQSPPGAWKSELERMPWKYSQQVKVEQALAAIRSAGFQYEAHVLAMEIATLKNELEAFRGRTSSAP
jgi:hypothetical protein